MSGYYYVAGTWRDAGVEREFEWKFDTSNPLRSIFKSDIEGKKWKSLKSSDLLNEKGLTRFGSVMWSGVDSFAPKKLKDLIKNSLSRFQIDISRGDTCLEVKIHLNSPQAINRPDRNLNATDINFETPAPNIFCIQTVSEFIHMIRNESRRDFLLSELLNNLAKRWKDDFLEFRDWRQTVEVFDCLEPETQQMIFQEMLKNCEDHDSFLAEKSFERLSAFMRRFCTMSFTTKPKARLKTSEIIRTINQAIAFLNNNLTVFVPSNYAINCLIDCLTIAYNYEIQDEIKQDALHIHEQIHALIKVNKNFYQSISFNNKFSLGILIQMVESIFIKSRDLTHFSKDLDELIKFQPLDFSWESFLENFNQHDPKIIPKKLIISLFVILKFHILKKSLNDIVKFIRDLHESIKNIDSAIKTRVYIESMHFIYGLIDLCELILDTYPDKNEVVAEIAALLETVFAKNTSQKPEKLLKETKKQFRKKVFLKKYGKIPSAEKAFKKTKELNSLLNMVPLISKLRAFKDYLEQDSQLNRDRKYIIDLHATQSPAFATNKREKISKLLQDYLVNNSAKFILILGANGSGKTLFLKNYVLQLYKSYLPGDPLPFFVPLICLSDPQKALMPETLDKFELSDYATILKDVRTVWYLDGFDEIFIDECRERTNFFHTNQLQNWQRAQFVVSCRTTFLTSGDEERLIAPLRLMSPLFISAFNEDDVNIFLKRFASDQWSVEHYRKLITHFNLDKMARNPFNLRIIAETLPIIIENELPDEMPLFLLFDHWVAYKVSDEFARQFEHEARNTHDVNEFLTFAIEISRLMGICQKQSIAKNDLQTLKNGAKITKNEYEKRLLKLTAELEKAQNSSNELQVIQISAEITFCNTHINQANRAPQRLLDMLFEEDSFGTLRRTCFLGANSKGEIQFIHPLMYTYFRSLDRSGDMIEHLKKIIASLI